MTALRPRLRSFVYFSPVEDGVVFRTWAGTFVLHGRGLYALLERLAPRLDGTASLDEICTGWSPESARKVAALLVKLQERGIIADESVLTPIPLSEHEKGYYGGTLAYLDLYLHDSGPAFVSFRESRIVLTGAGSALRGAARGLTRLGLRQLRVAPAGGRHEAGIVDADFERHHASDPMSELVWLDPERLGAEFESSSGTLVIHADGQAPPGRCRTLEQQCRSAGVGLLQAAIVAGHGIVSPADINGVSQWWSCLEARLSPGPGVASSLVELLLGNAVAFDAFRFITGTLPRADRDRVLTVDPDTLEMTRRRLIPLGSCAEPHRQPTAGEPSSDVRREFHADVTPEGVLDAIGPLLDPVLGVIPVAEPGEWEQVPLSLAEAVCRLPAGATAAYLAYADTALQARYLAVRAALERIAAADMWGAADGLPVSHNPMQETKRDAGMVCSGSSFAEMVGRGILMGLAARVAHASASAAARHGSVLPVALGSETEHWLQILRARYDLPVRIKVHWLGMLDATVAEVREDNGSLIACVPGRSREEAVDRALRHAVATVQARRASRTISLAGWGRSQAEARTTPMPTLVQGEFAGPITWREWTGGALDALRAGGRHVAVATWPHGDAVRDAGVLIGRVAIVGAAHT